MPITPASSLPPRRVLEQIAAEIQSEFSVTLDELQGPRRFAEIVQARCAFAARARAAGVTVSMTARFLNRTHGTLIHNAKRRSKRS